MHEYDTNIFETFLKQKRMHVLHRSGPDPQAFGNWSVTYLNKNLRIDIELDRRNLDIHISEPGLGIPKGYSASEVKALINDTEVQLMPIGESVQFIETNWEKITDLFRSRKRKVTRQRLDFLRREALRRYLPSWPKAILELEPFLVAKGLICRRRDAPEGALGVRHMEYSNEIIGIRMITKRSWHVELTDVTEMPEIWYDVRLLRSLLLNRGFNAPFSEWFEFIRLNWDKLIDCFSPQKRMETHRQLKLL